MNTIKQKEHPYYKNKRIEALSDFKKSYLVSAYTEDNFSDIRMFAKELDVTFQTLLIKIKYWQFEKLKQ